MTVKEFLNRNENKGEFGKQLLKPKRKGTIQKTNLKRAVTFS